MEELRKDYEIFTAAWKVYKSLLPVQEIENDAYWSKVAKTLEEIQRQYNTPLCDGLLLAVSAELERKGKQR